MGSYHDIRLVSTDFDGTIHEDFESAPIPGPLQDKLARLQASGVHWVINTGRDFGSLMDSLHRALPRVMPDFVVTVEREIYRRGGGRYTALEPWHTQCHADHAEAFALAAPDLAALWDALESRFDATFYKDDWSPMCAIARSNEQMDSIQAELEEFCRRIVGLAPVRNDVYVRLSHRSYNKGAALQEIQRQLGLGPGHTFAAGDHYNDLPMLEASVARWVAAPANAIPEVQATVASRGGHLAGARAGLGVLEALDRWTA